MGTVNFSVPDDVKEAFNTAFAGQNKSAVIAELMRMAVEQAARKQRSQAAMARVTARHAKAPVRSAAQVRSAREKGRP